MNIFVSGITGKVGRLLASNIIFEDTLILVGGTCSDNNPHLGNDIGELINNEKIGVNVTNHIPLNLNIDVIIDFSSPSATVSALDAAVERQIPVLIGTTGFDDSQKEFIENSSHKIPILLAPNTSQGIALFKELLFKTSDLFSKVNTFHIEEIHHFEKKDSPSGTALDLQSVIESIYPRSDVVVHSKREGNNPGEHKLLISFGSEEIEITHKAKDRNVFSRGAIEASKWLINKEPALYSMQDIYT